MAQVDRPSQRSLIDKLGIKPGMSVAILGDPDNRDFQHQLAERTDQVSLGSTPAGVAMIIVLIDHVTGLAQLSELRQIIARNGAIWVLWPKIKPGQPRLIAEDDVRQAALAIGLVDTKVVRFSERLGALRLVIPLAQR